MSKSTNMMAADFIRHLLDEIEKRDMAIEAMSQAMQKAAQQPAPKGPTPEHAAN